MERLGILLQYMSCIEIGFATRASVTFTNLKHAERVHLNCVLVGSCSVLAVVTRTGPAPGSVTKNETAQTTRDRASLKSSLVYIVQTYTT